jgi:hypothetical protein
MIIQCDIKCMTQRSIKLSLLLLLAVSAFAQNPADVDTLYRAVQIDGANYQAIITKPNSTASSWNA